MIDRSARTSSASGACRKLCTMEHLGSYCLTEPGAGSDAAALQDQRRARRRRLRPERRQAVHLRRGRSDVYVVMARTGEAGPRGISALRGREGDAGPLLRREREEDGLERAADAPGDLRGRARAGRQPARAEGKGFKIAMSGLNGGRLNIAACSLGGAQGALDRALAYMRTSARPSASASPTSRHCSSGSPTWRPSSRPRAPCSGAPPRRSTRRRPTRRKLCAMAKRFATDVGFQRRQRGAAAARRLRLPRRVRHREDRARPARASDPRRHQRDHARDHRARAGRARQWQLPMAVATTRATRDREKTWPPSPSSASATWACPMAAQSGEGRASTSSASTSSQASPRSTAQGGGVTRRRSGRMPCRGAEVGRSRCSRPASIVRARSGPRSSPAVERRHAVHRLLDDRRRSARKAHALAGESGCLSVDAPVSGGVGGAKARHADLHGGGSAEAFGGASRSSRRWASASCIAARPAPARRPRSATT